MKKRSHAPYEAAARKTFRSALCHLLQVEFPGLCGPAVTRLFADKINELYERFYPPRARLKWGQVCWIAVAADDPPARDKRIEDYRLIPLVLDLVTTQDIDETSATGQRERTRRQKIIRLFQQAYEQGAVLSCADVSLLLHLSIAAVTEAVREHEEQTGLSVPRRGTIHDMGRSVTHKAVICYKRLVENKPTSQVAQETFHSPEEVEYYVQCFRRIEMCRNSGMSPGEIVQATTHSLSLVEEYLALMKDFGFGL
jgi:hypothetical protein